jgi:L-ascorbate metabolism protein UlaG (beta-lactamase superfamily)
MSDKPSRQHEPHLRNVKLREQLLARVERSYPESDHYSGQHFFNGPRSEPNTARGMGAVFTWLRTRKPLRWPGWAENEKFPLPAPRLSSQIRDWRVTFINHATMLIQIGPYNLITDPVWSERVSPFKNLGPRRVRAAGVALKDLPPIDVVLLSHNHYDHLDLATLKFLEQRDHPHIVTGLGNAPLLHANGIKQVSELDWWGSMEYKDLKVHFTPAQHFSGRGLRDRNMTLWGGLWVETEAGSLFFAGDTGYGPHFSEIKKRLGSPRIALLPIGAYEPRWFMGPVHMNPDDAVIAHCDLAAEKSLAIHFNTFQLTDESIGQPVVDLAAALEKYSVNAADFLVLKEGEGKGF